MSEELESAEDKRLITTLVCKGKTIMLDQERTEEFTVSIVASVAKINFLVKAIGGTACEWKTKSPGIKQIYVCPTGYLPAVNLSGYQARITGLTKYRRDGCKYANGTGGKLSELFSFDFRDYMNQFDLGLPEEAQTIQIKVVFNAGSDWATAGAPTSASLTIQVIQDQSIDQSHGYRRYLSKDIPLLPINANTAIKEALARNGLFDSFILDRSKKGSASIAAPITDITVIRNEVDFPLKSTWDMEQAQADLHQDWATIDEDLCYCDLGRPINADPQVCKSLDLELGIGTIGGSDSCLLTVISEYVYFWN